MNLSILFHILLLLGSCAVLQALTIPTANQDGLIVRDELSGMVGDVVDIDRRPTKTKKPNAKSHKEFDICNLSRYGCLNDVDSSGSPEEGVIVPGRVGRDGDARSFEANIKTGAVKLRSKSYYSSGQLFDKAVTGLNLKEAWTDYQTDDVRKYQAQLFTKKPAGRKVDYVTEHIVELQSIMRFLEAVTRAKRKRGGHEPVKLNNKTDPQWFTTNWNKNVQAKIGGRHKKFLGYSESKATKSKNKSLNDIIFEGMGSQRHADDFILCETGINSGENLALLIGSKSKDPTGKSDYNLAAMRIEFMNAQPAQFEAKGETGVTEQVTHALPLYEKVGFGRATGLVKECQRGYGAIEEV
ncbi:hypothetical protein K458DRAFT_382368 [Lentithecium fluviatile CBS 122367]|uniref:ADP-ribosylation n=1 Tax=Lentithecium fluviatile CBS 122367 TaxID=1168545 RepID=A0A6G1JKP0_9PLEO|nr:hypothetical protein K458DRAFT_382368 [Lentithecium fluviatile CBS 122367]